MARNAFAFALFVLVGLPVSTSLGQATPTRSKIAPTKKAVPKAVQRRGKMVESQQAISTSDFEPKDRNRKGRVVPVRIYHDRAKDKYPVILFSHGMGGSRNNSPFLGNFWAKNGYVAVFIQHRGSDIEVIKDVSNFQKFRALKSAASWKSARDRVGDVSFVLDQLESWSQDKTHPLYGRLDLEHIGLSGHSFGAITTLTMAGRVFPLGVKATDEPRIDAFLPMSPQPGKSDPKEAFGTLSRPIFCMTGTEDRSVLDRSVTPEKRMMVYKSLPAGDKFHLVFDGAEHHAFGDYEFRFGKERDPAHHEIIKTLSLKFWDAYLKGDASAKNFLQSKSAASIDGFKKSDLFEWK